MSATTLTSPARAAVRLAGGHAEAHCLEMSWQLQRQLSDGYTRAAAMLTLDDFDAYLTGHRTARKRAARAHRLGYSFAEIDRCEHVEDIYAINTSAPRRQGRPMSAGYLERPVFSSNAKACDLHHVYTYGLLKDERLAAYLWLYRCGELAMVSSILGHADRLADDIMYLLATETIRAQIPLGGELFYNLWDSGTDGLRYFKERLGMQPRDVEWLA